MHNIIYNILWPSQQDADFVRRKLHATSLQDSSRNFGYSTAGSAPDSVMKFNADILFYVLYSLVHTCKDVLEALQNIW